MAKPKTRVVPKLNAIMTKGEKIPQSVVLENIKQYIFFGGEQISNILERLEEPAKLEYYEDVWTLVHNPKVDTSAGFVFTPDTMKQGYIGFPQKDFKTLNLIDNKRKLVIPLTTSVYHFLAEDVADIVKALYSKEYKDLEIIIDVSSVLNFMHNRSDYDMYWLLLQSFKDKGIKHKVINFKDFGAIYIDNFFLMSNGFSEFSRFNDIYDYFLDYVKEKDTIPTRKVYLSRSKVPEPEYVEYIDPETGENVKIKPVRIDDNDQLEKMFKKMGFEIIYPEDFETFEDQINFFYSVKTIASLTSSGLTNAIFMQPGGTVIEVITPLTARPISNGEPGYLNREFHNYYKNIAATKKHLYIGLPNPYASMEELNQFLDINENAKKILKQVK